MNFSKQNFGLVNACPTDISQKVEASKRLGCGYDKFNNSQYLCLPNVKKTSLVEFCHNGIMGYQEKGSCLEVIEETGQLTSSSCLKFSSGCPTSNFRMTEIYNHSACQEIDLRNHCYTLDSSCSLNQNTDDNFLIYGLLGGLVLIMIMVVFMCVLWRRRKQNSAEDPIANNVEDSQDKNVLSMTEQQSLLADERTEHLESDELAESRKLMVKREEKDSLLGTLSDATLQEMQRLLEEDKAFATLKRAVLSITYRIDEDTGMDGVYKNIQDVLQIGTIISQNLKSSIAEVKATCSFLSIVLQKDQYLLKNIKRLDNDKNYSELHHEWKSAKLLEESLLHSNTYLAHIGEGTSKDVVDTLQNIIFEKEIVEFLEDLQSEAKKLICQESKIKSSLEKKVKSAVLATKLVNLYSKIAILHSYVLWQVFCLKQRYGYDKSRTKGVFEMIDWCCKSNLDVLTCLTHPEVEHAVFLGVFHISENENVEHLLQIQDIEVPAVARRLYNKERYIQWSYSPDVTLQLKGASYGIWGNTETPTEACKFIFEPVEGREMDYIFYIRSACSGWANWYIQMKSGGTCKTVKNRFDKGVKWKLVSLMSDSENPNFIITSLDWPGRFLYLESPTSDIRGKRDLEKVKEKGLWKILDC